MVSTCETAAALSTISLSQPARSAWIFDLIAKSERWVSGNKSTMDACRHHLFTWPAATMKYWKRAFQKRILSAMLLLSSLICCCLFPYIQSVFKARRVSSWCCRERLLTAREVTTVITILFKPTQFFCNQFCSSFIYFSWPFHPAQRREELKMKCERAFYDTCYKFRANQFNPRRFLPRFFVVHARVEETTKSTPTHSFRALHFFFMTLFKTEGNI